MPQDWQNWCRFCAKNESTDTDTIYKIDSVAQQMELVNQHFMISMLPFDGSLTSMCGDCCGFLAKLKGFNERCLKAEKMFRDLMTNKSAGNLDLKCIRVKYGVEKEDAVGQKFQPQPVIEESRTEEPETIFEAFPDPLDMEEVEEPIAVKQETTEVADATTTRRNDNSPMTSAQNSKLFVISHNGRKIYMVVSYDGEEPDYDDFVRSACNLLKLDEITIYDQKEREISRDTFKYIFANNPPDFVLVKSGTSCKEGQAIRDTKETDPLSTDDEETDKDDQQNESENVSLADRWVLKNELHLYKQVVPKLREYIKTQTKIEINGQKMLAKGMLTEAERKLIMRVICDHLLKYRPNPKRDDKEAWAQATIILFPCLRVENSKTPFEAVYNRKTRSGYLQNRIRVSHRKKRLRKKIFNQETDTEGDSD